MNVLLIEPAYKNKYPPIGLMKIATYHKMRGDNVTFYKGRIKDLILDTMVNRVITNWLTQFPGFSKTTIPCNHIRKYICTGSKISLSSVEKVIGNHSDIIQYLIHIRKKFFNKTYLNDSSWKWDRVYITTLFTFYWSIIIPTIIESKVLVKSLDNFYVGGVAATILKEQIMRETALEHHNLLTGLLDQPGRLDPEDTVIIDELPLDYSILDEIDYQYKEHGNYYGYMTRGCVRRCKFCVVHIIEPKYRKYIPFREKLEATRNTYGEQKHLLLLDNNVLASGQYDQIISEIRDAGFHKGATFDKPDYLTINIAQLEQGHTDRGRIIKTTKLLLNYLNKLPESEYKKNIKALYSEQNLFLNMAYLLPDPNSLIHTYNKIKDHYLKTFKSTRSRRYVDFNQGVDARLITDQKMRLLSQIAIRPLRIAFDNWDMKETYTRAIKTAVKHGIHYLSNYLLYNFEDKPIELYYRMRHNVELAQELDVEIFSFPMKYHPVRDIEYFSNRTYIGAHWNRKYIRAIQLVLNATKGKVGSSLSFFRQAFGKNEEEYYKILLMPEQFIFYRAKNTQNGQIEQWWEAYNNLKEQEKRQAATIILTNHFDANEWQELPAHVRRVLDYYL